MTDAQKIERDKKYAMEQHALSLRPAIEITAKEHASIVRKELKKRWPTARFSVVSDQFAGGDSVKAYCVNKLPENTTWQEVDEFVGKFNGYRGDNFDGRYNIGFEYEGKLYQGASFCSYNHIKHVH